MVIDTNKRLSHGYGMVADSMKMLIYKQNPDLFNKIDFENDTAFTKPQLFANFNSNLEIRPTLDQILLSYFKELDESETFEVVTDNSGIIYIPEYGYLITNNKKERLTCSYDGNLKLHINSEVVNYKLEPIQKVGDTSVSLYTHSSPLLDPFFRDSNGKSVKVKLLKDELLINDFEQALKIIKKIESVN